MPRQSTPAGSKPLHVSLVAIPEAVISTLSGIYDVMSAFSTMSSLGSTPAQAPPFRVEIVGLRSGPLELASRIPVTVQRSVAAVESTDIIIVPSILLGRDGWRKGAHPELVEWFRGIDSAKATTNLWGERWSKLVQNAMGNGVTAATGMTTPACLGDRNIRRFQIALAGEGIRVGQALGYELEKIRAIEPELLARAAEGDAGALAEVESAIVPKSKRATASMSGMPPASRWMNGTPRESVRAS